MDYLVKAVRKVMPFAFLEPEGSKGIRKIGHREYVGGLWHEIGSLQLEFLKSSGLSPHSYLLDIACGSLRLGVKAIPYLEPEHYLGIEKESGLVAAGFENELDKFIKREKRPHIVISDTFEFDKFGQQADFAISQALFGHLPAQLIDLCFQNLHPWLADDGVFYATFFPVEVPRENPVTPHAHGYFAYTNAQMLSFGQRNGYSANYLGGWNHPRGQVIVEYRKA